MSAFLEFPSVDEMDAAALPWAAANGSYHTDALKEVLARHFKLGPELLDRRRRDGTHAFSNRVDWLTARWTTRRLHAGAKKHYRLTQAGYEEARRRGVAQPRHSRTLRSARRTRTTTANRAKARIPARSSCGRSRSAVGRVRSATP